MRTPRSGESAGEGRELRRCRRALSARHEQGRMSLKVDRLFLGKYVPREAKGRQSEHVGRTFRAPFVLSFAVAVGVAVAVGAVGVGVQLRSSSLVHIPP